MNRKRHITLVPSYLRTRWLRSTQTTDFWWPNHARACARFI